MIIPSLRYHRTPSVSINAHCWHAPAQTIGNLYLSTPYTPVAIYTIILPMHLDLFLNTYISKNISDKGLFLDFRDKPMDDTR